MPTKTLDVGPGVQFTLQQLISAGLPATSTDGNGSAALTEFSRTLTPAEWLVYLQIACPAAAVLLGSPTEAANIPNWATWTETQVLAWFATNVDTPLAVAIPATITLVQARSILASMQSIMQAMAAAQEAEARMIVALRNSQWPTLQGP